MEDLVPKPGMMKSLVWTYFGFVAGADGSPTYIIIFINIIVVVLM